MKLWQVVCGIWVRVDVLLQILHAIHDGLACESESVGNRKLLQESVLLILIIHDAALGRIAVALRRSVCKALVPDARVARSHSNALCKAVTCPRHKASADAQHGQVLPLVAAAALAFLDLLDVDTFLCHLLVLHQEPCAWDPHILAAQEAGFCAVVAYLGTHLANLYARHWPMVFISELHHEAMKSV